MTNRKVK